ncbi:hypothetical protein GCM10023170_074360 [Phytohabitans houttuyneae]|uniref:universal stress protein n=1 Tax=Phytohabitans houttuyneae TaxID=1076126 RepID=UPI0031EE099F
MRFGGTTVVVGVKDFGLDAATVRAGAREAAAAGGWLRVVHAFVWPLFTSGHGEEREEAEEAVETAAAYARTVEPGLLVSAAVVDGAPVSVLRRAATPASLLVLGGHGLAALGTEPQTSVSIQLAARTATPVMFVREDERAGPVVVGMDGSPDADAALRLAVVAARRRRTGLVVLHAGGAPCPGEMQAVRLAAHRMVAGPPEDALIRESWTASLIVVGARGDRPTLLGPVTQAVLRHAASPVLVAHAGSTVPPAADRREKALAG